jgi:hypothetical protein
MSGKKRGKKGKATWKSGEGGWKKKIRQKNGEYLDKEDKE